jgi:hypothetical protein
MYVLPDSYKVQEPPKGCRDCTYIGPYKCYCNYHCCDVSEMGICDDFENKNGSE